MRARHPPGGIKEDGVFLDGHSIWTGGSWTGVGVMSDRQQGTGHGHGPYRVGGQVLQETDSPEAQRVLATAHEAKERPRCLCRAAAPEMYVAKVPTSSGRLRFVVKRMPETGVAHDAGCGSYLPPEHLSGLGQVLEHAIAEDPDEDRTALRLGFALSKTAQAAPESTGDGEPADTVATDGTRLTLRAVLHYLWQEAGFTTWSPAMEGKRTWRVISWHLREAARGKYVKGAPLTERLWIPEPFSADRKAQLAAARVKAWAPARAGSSSSKRLMLLVGEVKALEPARFGHRLVVKHVPDAPFMVPDDLLRRLNRRFADEIAIWQAEDDVHLMAIATFSVGRGGVPSVEEMSLTLVDERWLPFEDEMDRVLVQTATSAKRRFTKSLRYNLARSTPMASLVFTDTGDPATAAYVFDTVEDAEVVDSLAEESGTVPWVWVLSETMPDLPGKAPWRPEPSPVALASPASAAERPGAVSVAEGNVERDVVLPVEEPPWPDDEGMVR